MCVFGCGDIIIARIQNVGLGIDVVVRLQLLLIKSDRYGFACAGSQLCSFGIAHQLHSSLFHLVCLVVIGIGALCIDLYDILASHITRIGDLDSHGAGIAIPAGIVIRPLKIRVGQAVSKGIHHSIRIVVITGIALTQHLVLVAGLVVAVANIDALFVADVVVLGQAAVLVIVGKVAKVLGGRAVHGIHLVGVHGAAGRIYLAGEDLCQRAQTIITHSGSRNDGMDAGVILDPAQVYRCAGVQQQHHIVKVVVQILKDLQFRRIRFQIGFGLILFHIGVVVHGAGHITAFARHTAEHKNRNRILHGIGQTRLCFHNRQGAFVDGKVLVITVGNGTNAQTVVLAVAFGIKLPERFINAKACIFKSSFHIDLIAANVADCRMADKTEGRIRAVRHLSRIVLQ